MKKLILSIAAIFMVAQVQAAEVKLMNQPKLTLEAAKVMIEAAKVEAANKKSAVTIAIVNPDGTLIALEKMDYTPMGTVMGATEKAKSAIAFGVPTQMLSDWAFGEDLKGGIMPYIGSGKLFAIGGGLPIYHNNQLLGAIGTSGAVTPALDDEIGEAAIRALMEKL